MLCSSLALVGVGLISTSASAMAIDRRVTVQPIQVCNSVSDGGGGCANQNQQLFAAETNKIWEQAGIEINFLSFRQFNNTSYKTIDNYSELYDLFDSPGHQANSDSLVLSMWFVDSILPAFGGVTYGIAYYPGNRLAIGNDVFSYNNWVGRLDTIAHEIGHNLGLGHNDLGAGGSTNVMSSGSVRSVPGSINEIVPNGADLDELTAAQISTARSSKYARDITQPPTPQAVPTPPLFLGLMGIGRLIWCKRSQLRQS